MNAVATVLALSFAVSPSWPQKVLVHQAIPASEVVQGHVLFSLVSRTTSPERGPYRLTRRDLASGSVTVGPLVQLPQITAASGRLWVSGTIRRDAIAAEVDATTLRVIRTVHLGRALAAFPRVAVAPGPGRSIWLGSDATLVRIAVASGRTVARAPVPAGYAVSDTATDPARRHLYVALTKRVAGGVAGAAVLEYDAATGRERARNLKDVSSAVAGAALTAVPDGVWASFRTGNLGTTVRLSSRGLMLVPHPRAARIFDWPMNATTFYTRPSLWIANEAGFVACVDPSTGRVRASERLDASDSLQLLGADPARKRIVAIDQRLRVVALEPPPVCW